MQSLTDKPVVPAAPAADVSPTMNREIIFEVHEDEVDGGFHAAAVGHDIFTQGDTLAELRDMVRDAVACHFGDPARRPALIRLHFVRDEVLAA